MPLLSHGVDHTALDWSPAGSADGHTHLVMAGQTVELSLQLPGICRQLFAERNINKTNKMFIADLFCQLYSKF